MDKDTNRLIGEIPVATGAAVLSERLRRDESWWAGCQAGLALPAGADVDAYLAGVKHGAEDRG